MKKPKQDNRFQTHIKEPRWQQIVSLAVIIVIIIAWIVAAIYG